MVDATISRARLHDLARLGRSRLQRAGGAGPPQASASRRHAAADAASIADDLPARPRAASSRPEVRDLMAPTI